MPSNHARFVPGLIEYDTQQPGVEWTAGVKTVGKRKALGRTVTETGLLIEKVPGERITWDGTLLGISSRGTWSVEAAEGGSRVTLSGEMEQNMLMGLMSKLGIANVEKAQSDVLNALKQKLETSIA